jgi:hypothetical protein
METYRERRQKDRRAELDAQLETKLVADLDSDQNKNTDIPVSFAIYISLMVVIPLNIVLYFITKGLS